MPPVEFFLVTVRLEIRPRWRRACAPWPHSEPTAQALNIPAATLPRGVANPLGNQAI